ncbi:hypothetical protein BH11BAC4_BH11BAC4_22430 [soil metagenome]
MYKRNILPGFLLFLLAMPLLFSVYTIVEKQLIEYEMEEEFGEGNLLTITIDPADILWFEENREAAIHGKMFDVKTIHRNGNKLVLTGLFDTREDKLKEKLQAFNDHGKRPLSAKTSLLILLFSTYSHTGTGIDLISPVCTLQKASWPINQHSNYNAFREVIIPPPRNGFSLLS